jgi:hypothetical protein
MGLICFVTPYGTNGNDNPEERWLSENVTLE